MIDDTEQVDISDGGSIPPTSTKPNDWYYTKSEWSRLGMWGPLPDERNAEFGGDTGIRRDEEKSEENIKN